MVSVLHEAVLTLFRNRPDLAPELLREAVGAPVPSFDRALLADTSLNDVVPTEYRADVVVRLQSSTGTAAAVVVEAQLRRDGDKRWSWPAYLATLRARLRCDVMLLVITLDAAVADWARAPIAMGHPGWSLAPIVVGPDRVPIVRDSATAERSPELAVLSAMAHGQDPEAEAVGKAALAAFSHLDEERATLYLDLVFATAHEAARRALEALMAQGNYEYQSDFARRYFSQGKAEGEAKGKAQALLTVLHARGLPLGDEERARILACADGAALDRWLARAATAAVTADVFGD